MKNVFTKNRCTKLSVFVLLSVMLVSCFTIRQIIQPTKATPGELIDIAIIADNDLDDDMGDSNIYSLVGVLLPVGWEVVLPSEALLVERDGEEVFTGDMERLEEYEALLDYRFGTPDGFYWWGGSTLEKVPYVFEQGGVFCENVMTCKLKVQIPENAAAGSYQLQYVIGDGGYGDEPEIVENRDTDLNDKNTWSATLPTILTGATNPNGELADVVKYQVDPVAPIEISDDTSISTIDKGTYQLNSLSKGELSIDLKDRELIGTVISVYDLTGKQVYSQVLTSLSETIQLNTSGIVLVTLQNANNNGSQKLVVR